MNPGKKGYTADHAGDGGAVPVVWVQITILGRLQVLKVTPRATFSPRDSVFKKTESRGVPLHSQMSLTSNRHSLRDLAQASSTYGAQTR